MSKFFVFAVSGAVLEAEAEAEAPLFPQPASALFAESLETSLSNNFSRRAASWSVMSTRERPRSGPIPVLLVWAVDGLGSVEGGKAEPEPGLVGVAVAVPVDFVGDVAAVEAGDNALVAEDDLDEGGVPMVLLCFPPLAIAMALRGEDTGVRLRAGLTLPIAPPSLVEREREPE